MRRRCGGAAAIVVLALALVSCTREGETLPPHDAALEQSAIAAINAAAVSLADMDLRPEFSAITVLSRAKPYCLLDSPGQADGPSADMSWDVGTAFPGPASTALVQRLKAAGWSSEPLESSELYEELRMERGGTLVALTLDRSMAESSQDRVVRGELRGEPDGCVLPEE